MTKPVSLEIGMAQDNRTALPLPGYLVYTAHLIMSGTFTTTSWATLTIFLKGLYLSEWRRICNYQMDTRKKWVSGSPVLTDLSNHPISFSLSQRDKEGTHTWYGAASQTRLIWCVMFLESNLLLMTSGEFFPNRTMCSLLVTIVKALTRLTPALSLQP